MLTMFVYFLNRPGASTPSMYTEVLPGGQLLALIIPSLTETMAGSYYCSASYANTEILEASVDIQTFGKFSLKKKNLLNWKKEQKCKHFWILVAITWRNAPENQYPIAGKDYTVQCEVSANPAPTVDWLRNGDTVSETSWANIYFFSFSQSSF